MKVSLCASMLLSLSVASFADEALAENYDVYLLAGQSNMDGRGRASHLSPAQRQPFENVVIFYRNPPHATKSWQPLAPGYSIPPKYDGELPAPTFGPELGFAWGMTKAQPERKLALIKGSKGGTSLKKDWNPGVQGEPSTQGPRYRDFLETIRLASDALTRAGHTFQLRGLLWHQGESDSRSSKEVYEKRLLRFIARIREDTGAADLPVILGEVFDNGKRDSVRQALRAVGSGGPRFGFVSSADTTTWDEGTHFDAPSQLTLGRRYAEAMLKINDAHTP